MSEDNKTKKIIDFFNKDSHAFLIILAAMLLVAVAAIVFISMRLVSDDAAIAQDRAISAKEKEPAKDAPPYRHTDGVLVVPGRENLYPVAVMIENHSVVRPQAGLGSASVVYETLAEGGITRFVAVFAGAEVTAIGPVRSARPYYLEWSSEYDALYAHAGGSPEALSAISGEGIKNLNYLGGAAGYFYREGCCAPHNLFTSGELLARALRDKELKDISPAFSPWLFADDPAEAERGTVSAVDVYFANSPLYTVHYEYQKATNSYKRFHGTTPHTDANTGNHIEAKNVIVQFVPEETFLSSGKGRIDLDLHGEGVALVFRSGEAVVGTWKKQNRTDRTRFYDADGAELMLARGPVWIEVLPGTRKATYTVPEGEVVYEGGKKL